MKTLILGVLAVAGASFAGGGNDFSSSEATSNEVDYPVLRISTWSKGEAKAVAETKAQDPSRVNQAATPSDQTTAKDKISVDQKKSAEIAKGS